MRGIDPRRGFALGCCAKHVTIVRLARVRLATAGVNCGCVSRVHGVKSRARLHAATTAARDRAQQPTRAVRELQDTGVAVCIDISLECIAAMNVGLRGVMKLPQYTQDRLQSPATPLRSHSAPQAASGRIPWLDYSFGTAFFSGSTQEVAPDSCCAANSDKNPTTFDPLLPR